jgi:hypothetical protein
MPNINALCPAFAAGMAEESRMRRDRYILPISVTEQIHAIKPQ